MYELSFSSLKNSKAAGKPPCFFDFKEILFPSVENTILYSSICCNSFTEYLLMNEKPFRLEIGYYDFTEKLDSMGNRIWHKVHLLRIRPSYQCMATLFPVFQYLEE